MSTQIVYFVVDILFVFLAVFTSCTPLKDCTKSGNFYQADGADPCIFYRCVFGILRGPFYCAPGSGVPYGYFGPVNPCVLGVPRCDRPSDTNTYSDQPHSTKTQTVQNANFNSNSESTANNDRNNAVTIVHTHPHSHPPNNHDHHHPKYEMFNQDRQHLHQNQNQNHHQHERLDKNTIDHEINGQSYNGHSHSHVHTHHHRPSHLEDKDARKPSRKRRTFEQQYFPRQYLENAEQLDQEYPRQQTVYQVQVPSFKIQQPENQIVHSPRPRLNFLSKRDFEQKQVERSASYSGLLRPIPQHQVLNHQTIDRNQYANNEFQKRALPQSYKPRQQSQQQQLQYQQSYNVQPNRGSYRQGTLLQQPSNVIGQYSEPPAKTPNQQYIGNRNIGVKLIPSLLSPPVTGYDKAQNNQLGLKTPQDKRLAISNWYNQHNQMLNLQQHRQDSVEQGTSFDVDDETEDGVLNTNAVWPDVLKNFNHQIIPLVRTEQNNVTLNTNGNTLGSIQGPLYNRSTIQFPREVFGEKVYNNTEQTSIKDKQKIRADLREQMKYSSIDVKNAENYRSTSENENGDKSDTINSAILPDPGQVQIRTENVGGQIALIEQMVTYKDFHIKGGTLIQIGIKERQCSELCMRNPYCLAFDYNKVHAQCWFHSGDSYCGVLERRVGCTHYKRIPCVKDQKNSFREIVYGVHVSGGENLCTTCSLSNCLRMCAELSDSTCQAVDYNWQVMSCHMHRNTTACHPVIPRVTCAHYRRISCGDDQMLTDMSPLTINNDPGNDRWDNTQLTQLLLQTFPQSPSLPTYSRDVNPGVQINLPNSLGTFLVSVIQQQWREDPESTTVVPIDLQQRNEKSYGRSTTTPTYTGSWFRDNLGERTPQQLPAVHIPDSIQPSKTNCRNCKYHRTRPRN